MTQDPQFETIDAGNGSFIKAWNKGVQFEDKAVEQLRETARLPFVKPYVAAMPDVHGGIGATVGSVVPMQHAIVPAAVGVDIGCGVCLTMTNATRDTVRDALPEIRARIEKGVPHGRSDDGGSRDCGSWGNVPEDIQEIWEREFASEYNELCEFRHSGARSKNAARQLGTLGTGNHFIELVVDESGRVGILIHSGSRGLGNRVGSYFMRVASQHCEQAGISLPHRDLAYLAEGTSEFADYISALHLAQRFAFRNRLIIMDRILRALSLREVENVHCHHNYMEHEEHFGERLMITRKGAVRARLGDMGVIPGSMGAKSYVVRGLGSEHSFHSCSHGAGRRMGRKAALKAFTVEDHIRATEGVECHKGAEVLDETPGAYKDIDAVMEAQKDLVEIVYSLKQLVCVKGLS
jgi:tRNA-splicing ligase RtcB (3'-phosphate/5'-hydroxy nucleic acid ligase)